MAKMFDCATPLTYEKAKEFFDAGFTHVARYLVPSGWKRLTKEEADNISRAGLETVSVFEIMGDRASMTASQGSLDGQIALACALEVCQPEGSTIYFAVDFEPTPQDLPNILAYIQACSEATPNYNTGAYGNYTAIEYVASNNGCSHFWQTYAWSHGNISPHANIYQNENDITVNGIGVDIDVANFDVGSWSTTPFIEPEIPEPEQAPSFLSAEDANKFAAMCAELYTLDAHEIHGADGTPYEMNHDEYHRLANVARAAAGLPTT